MPTPPVALLAAGMLVAGTVNTIATKMQDLTPVDAGAGRVAFFHHPALQSAAMFLGEALCLVGAAAQARRGARAGGDAAAAPRPRASAVLAFALPAACDAVATTALNAGLALTSASTFQMLRGTLVAWAGLFTQALLRRRLRPHHWFGIALIVAGAAVVGAASIVFDEGGGDGGGDRAAPPANPALGVALVVASQAVTALQFIVEEALLARTSVPPLLAVGLEGAWGLALCAAALPALAHSFARPDGSRAPPVDDAWAGLAQVAASPRLAASMALTVVSIAAFNGCGLAVTARLSGAARAATDAVRTLAVWGVALAAGWEAFWPGGVLQLFGFGLLLTGAALFNGLVRSCLPDARAGRGEEAEEEGAGADAPLLVEDGPPLPPPPPLVAEDGAPAPPPRPPRRTAAPRAAARPPSRAPSHYTTLARSMRLPPAALSPHSLLDATPSSAGGGGLLGRSDSETGGGRA